MNKNMTWGLIGVALFVGVFIGYSIEKQRATDKLEATKMMMQKQVDDAKMTANKKQENSMVKSADLVMMAKSQTLGTYVTGPNDMTLYTYDKDEKNESYCTGKCVTTWPPYLVSGETPSALPEHMGTFKRDDGSMQYKWDGKLLYYYSGDKKVGDINGDNIGGVWHVAK